MKKPENCLNSHAAPGFFKFSDFSRLFSRLFSAFPRLFSAFPSFSQLSQTFLSFSRLFPALFQPSMAIYLLSSTAGFTFFGTLIFRIPSSNLALISSWVTASPT